MGTLEDCIARFNARAYDEACTLAIDLVGGIQRIPSLAHRDALLVALLISAARTGRLDGAFAAASRALPDFDSVLFWVCSRILFVYKSAADLRTVLDGIGPDSKYYAYRLFLTGILRGLDRDSTCRRYFHDAAARLQADSHRLVVVEQVRNDILTGLSSEDDDWIDAHVPPWTVPSLPEAGADRGFLLFSACDKGYLDHFMAPAAESLRSLGRRLDWHIHVHRGDADGHPPARILYDDGQVAVTTSSDANARGNPYVYYSCLRFLHARRLLEETGRPLLIVDIDNRFSERLLQVPTRMTGVDVGLFELGDPRPCMHFGGGIVYVANTPGGHLFCHLVEHYIARKLPEAIWMLDQSALYCIEAYCRNRGLPVAFGRINESPGQDMTAFLIPFEDERAVKDLRDARRYRST